MPTSAPGSKPVSAPGQAWHPGLSRSDRDAARGFTLIELLIVVAIVALASGLVSLGLRDPQASALAREADRLSALLESARAESRASGLVVMWVPASAANLEPGSGFRFHGLPAALKLPEQWLTAGVQAEVLGARSLTLGPEPMIGAQQVNLRLGDQRLSLVTDGLAPFEVATSQAGSTSRPAQPGIGTRD